MLESSKIMPDSRTITINIVYERLFWNEIHSFHRGNITVLWTPHPIEQSDIYAYFSPSSFRGKTKGLDVLLLLESITVLPGAYDEKIWKCFDHVLTLCDAVAAFPDLATHVYHPRSHWINSSPITEDINERDNKYPIRDRKRAICMINGNKKSSVPSELYSIRELIAKWFHKHSALPFDVFGNPPFPWPNYKGILPPDAKLATLSQYSFSLCFENVSHPVFSTGYISEKILDCFEARTIPIYWGCANVNTRIPKECYIHLTDFPSIADLEHYLHTMSQDDYLGYISAIDRWVVGGGLRPYSWLAVYNMLFDLWKKRDGAKIDLSMEDNNWESGLPKNDVNRQFALSHSPRVWNWSALADASSPLLDTNPEVASNKPDYFSAKSPSDAQVLEDSYGEVRKSLQTGRINITGKKIRMILAKEPHHIRALNDLGVICSRRGEKSNALKYFLAAAQSGKTDRIAIYNLIGSLLQMGRRDDAIATLKSSLESDTDRNLADIGDLYLGVFTKKNEIPPPLFHHESLTPGKERELRLLLPKSRSGILRQDFLNWVHQWNGSQTFIETNTYQGHTAAVASRVFPSVHTIESDDILAIQAQDRFATVSSVVVHKGESGIILSGLLQQVKDRHVVLLNKSLGEDDTKTTSVIVELESISKSGIKEAIIIIDNIHFFQNSRRSDDSVSLSDNPISLPEVCKKIQGIDAGYRCIILGDILVALPDGCNVKTSEVIDACTGSWIWNGPPEQLDEIVKIDWRIAEAQGEEFNTLQELWYLFGRNSSQGIGEHYSYWYALALLRRSQFLQAGALLKTLIASKTLGYRARWFLSHVMLGEGNKTFAVLLLAQLLKDVPSFQAGKTMYEKSNASLAQKTMNKENSRETVLKINTDFQNPQTQREDVTMQNKAAYKDGDIVTRLRSTGLWHDGQPLRLHLGCGENHFDGYVNIDFPPSEHTTQTRVAADLFADITLLDFPDEAVDEIRLHHVFEHFGRSQALALLIRWHGWLKVGGILHIETPDVIGCAKALLSNIPYKTKQAFLRHAFGSHEAMWAYHYDGWYEEKFQHVLTQLGFEVRCRLSQWRNDPKLTNVEAIAIKKLHVNKNDLLKAADSILLDSMVADVPGEQLMHKVWCDLLRDELDKVSKDVAPSSVHQEKIVGISIKTDSPAFDSTGYNNDNIMTNGEFNVLTKIVKKGDVIFDVGANKGNWSKFVLEKNPDVKIFAFEPVPETFHILENNVKGQNAVLYNLAISNEDKQKTFYHWANSSESGELSSLYRRHEVERRMNIAVRPIAVQSRTLDSFCKENSINHIDFLKIDTEGAELDVLNGAAKLLDSKSICTIQFEYGGTYRDSGITLKQIFELMQRKGYQIFRIIENGLLHIPSWRDALENYQYANYIATEAKLKEPGEDSKGKEDVLITTPVRSMVAVVFSKDRAMQLDCELRSFYLHCKDPKNTSLKVLYTTSSNIHERQYAVLRQQYADVEFIRETQFKENLLAVLSSYTYILFLVDDNIFVGDIYLGDSINALSKKDNALGLSLRLGRNTTYSYMTDKQQVVPAFTQEGGAFLSFDWTTAELDFGYPLEVSSSIYRTADLLPFLKTWDFKNPNTLELQMDLHKSTFRTGKNILLCFSQSRCFCNPVNMVQTMWATRSGKTSSYTPEKLRELFEQGLRIDSKRFSGHVPNSCHQEVDFEFIPYDSLFEVVRPDEEKNNDLFVTIGILNWNGVQHIKLCLESIRRNTPEPHEIIVVDNGSTDGSVEYLKEQKDIILILNPENIGDHGARNQFMSISCGNYIVFLDNDTIVTKYWIKKFLAHMESDPQIGMIGACSNYASGLQGISGVTYNTIEEMEAYADRRAQEYRGKLVRSPRLVTFCVFIRRAAADKIGAMETGFSKTGFSDDDYSLRMEIAGFKSVVANDVFIHHTGGPTGRGDLQYGKWHHEAWTGFKRKWGLPAEQPISASYDAGKLIQQHFDPKRHYIQLPPRTSVEQLIYTPSRENMTQGGRISSVASVHEGSPKQPITKGLTSIIILQSGELRPIKQCIESIKKHTTGAYEIVIVTSDGKSGENTQKLRNIVGKKAALKLIEHEIATGFAKGVNIGVQKASGEYILVLDQHVVVSDEWLAGMLKCFQSSPDAGIIGPLSNGGEGHQKVSIADPKTIARLEEFSRKFKERNLNRRVKVNSIAGFCILFRNELIRTVGLFDESLESDFFSIEDFCKRTRLHGLNNYIAGDVFVQWSCDAVFHGSRRLFDEKWRAISAQIPLGTKMHALTALEQATDFFDKNRLDDAIMTLMAGITQAPAEKTIYLYLAEILIDAKRFQDALDAIGGLPDNEKNDIRTLELVGCCKEGLGLDGEAQEQADRVLGLNLSSSTALNLKGILAYKKGDRISAESFFTKAIEADPGYGEPYTNIGMLQWAAGQQESALTYFEKGFILSPAIADIITSYHMAVTTAGAFKRAEQVFQDAKMLHPRNRNIAFLLIDLQIKQENYMQAMLEIEQAMILVGIDDGILAAALEIRDKIGPQDMKLARKNEKSLSLAMIVKNEEQYLAKCLMSVKPIANEMIVVDTGSNDRTKGIAKAFGAKVFDIEWTDDFSAARNVALSKASGDWIFVMDADEVISEQDYHFFFDLLRKTGVPRKAFLLNTRNYTNVVGLEGFTVNDEQYYKESAGVGWVPSKKVRLFPRNESIRFENPVHELVEPSIQRKGFEIVYADIPVHHYGRLNQEKLMAKHEKYYALGINKLREKPNDIKALKELAVQAGELHKWKEALELWNFVIGLNPNESLAYYNMGSIYLYQTRYGDALVASKKAVELDPTRKEAVTNYAVSELLVGDVAIAGAVLKDLNAKNTDYPVALALLAAISFINDDVISGNRFFEKIRKMNFNAIPFVQDTSERLVECGRIDFAKKLLDGALAFGHKTRELEILREECRKKLMAEK